MSYEPDWDAPFWRLVHPEALSGCWLWHGYYKACGWGSYTVNGHPTLVGRVAWTLANGPVPDGLCVCHRCDVPGCCNPDHLFLGTSADNHRDKVVKGRAGSPGRGSANRHAKLTQALVDAARKRVSSGESIKRLAAEYGVGKTAMWKAVHGVSWDGPGVGSLAHRKRIGFTAAMRKERA